MKLDELTKFCADYSATLGDDSVFLKTTHFVVPPTDNIILINDHDGFALKPKKLVKN